MNGLPQRYVVERDLSIALSVLAVISISTRVFLRARSLLSREQYPLIYLSDFFIGVAFLFQIFETASRLVNSHEGGWEGVWGTTNIVASYLVIWCSRMSLLVLLLAGRRHSSLEKLKPTVGRTAGVTGNLAIPTGLCVGLLYQNLAISRSAMLKQFGVSHIVVYLIATAWLLWNAHRTITIERRMSWFKWRILLASAGADLICTVVSVTRGAMILLEISHDMGIISVLECGITIPMENAPFIFLGIYNLLYDLWRKRMDRSSSPIIFRMRTSTEIYNLDQVNDSESGLAGNTESSSAPSAGSKTASLNHSLDKTT